MNDSNVTIFAGSRLDLRLGLWLRPDADFCPVCLSMRGECTNPLVFPFWHGGTYPVPLYKTERAGVANAATGIDWRCLPRHGPLHASIHALLFGGSIYSGITGGIDPLCLSCFGRFSGGIDGARAFVLANHGADADPSAEQAAHQINSPSRRICLRT